MGRLGAVSMTAFDGMQMSYDGGQTVLIADLDQAALYDVVQRVYARALELVSVMREPERPEQ
jgi:hypothetical protein